MTLSWSRPPRLVRRSTYVSDEKAALNGLFVKMLSWVLLVVAFVVAAGLSFAQTFARWPDSDSKTRRGARRLPNSFATKREQVKAGSRGPLSAGFRPRSRSRAEYSGGCRVDQFEKRDHGGRLALERFPRARARPSAPLRDDVAPSRLSRDG
jgi:hypothetical protein